MQIWLDTVNLEVIKDAVKKGVINGITTNPSILSKCPHIQDTLNQLLEVQNGPVAVQVTSSDTHSMVDEGRHIFQFSNRMIVKIPVNAQGLEAMRQLRECNIPVLGTAIFDSTQALLAAKLDAAYIAPYFSHIGKHACEVIKTISTLMKAQNYKTQIMAASIKTLEDLMQCALLGVDAVTIKDDLFYKFIDNHSSFEKISQKFAADWHQAFGKNSIKHFLINQ